MTVPTTGRSADYDHIDALGTLERRINDEIDGLRTGLEAARRQRDELEYVVQAAVLRERTRILASVKGLPGVTLFGERILYPQFVDRAAVLETITDAS